MNNIEIEKEVLVVIKYALLLVVMSMIICSLLLREQTVLLRQ